MIWQDWILTSGSLVFSIALLPTVWGKDKPALSTSLMTGTILLVFSVVYFTLSLWFSAITTIFAGILWIILAIQKYTSHKE